MSFCCIASVTYITMACLVVGATVVDTAVVNSQYTISTYIHLSAVHDLWPLVHLGIFFPREASADCSLLHICVRHAPNALFRCLLAKIIAHQLKIPHFVTLKS